MRTHFRSMHVCLCKVAAQSTFPQHEPSQSRDLSDVRLYLRLQGRYSSGCQLRACPCRVCLSCTIVPALEGIIYADRSRDWMWATNFSLISPDTGTRDMLRVTVGQSEADTRAQSQSEARTECHQFSLIKLNCYCTLLLLALIIQIFVPVVFIHPWSSFLISFVLEKLINVHCAKPDDLGQINN